MRSVLILIVCLTEASSALVIRHDTPTLSYENYGKESQFNASTGISRSSDNEYGIAGATAIDSRWGVHARHTLRHVETWMDAGNGANLRGTRWNAWNFQGLANVGVRKVHHFDDDFTRFANAIDISLVLTNAKSSTLRIAPLFGGWDEVGRVGSGASAANNRRDGNGIERKTEAQNTSNSGRWYEVRWAGKNDIDQVNTQSLGSPNNALLKIDFDHPTNTNKSAMGGDTAIDLEYGTMNGDSGSPIYVTKNGLEGQVAGVVSGGSGNLYGDTGIYVRTRPYNTWIFDTILANPDNRAMTFSTTPDQVVDLGETMAVTVASSGSEQGPLTPTISLINPPAGMKVNAKTGEITWTPTAAQAGIVHTIVVKVTEDGVVANSRTDSFDVTVVGSSLTEFWNWSGSAPSWSGVSVSGGGPYALSSALFPYLQGGPNNLIHQQIIGAIPPWANVTVGIKLADFEQTWSTGGPIEYGFRDVQPNATNADADFLFSSIANVPNYNGVPLVDGLGNTGGNVDYSFNFETTVAIVDPWFVVRKNEDGSRYAVDDIQIRYYVIDADQDGLPDAQEASIGTNPDLADTDGDGLNDGPELTTGTDPLMKDTDRDGYSDGYEVNVTGSNAIDADDPGGPNKLAIGINFVSASGNGVGVGLPALAHAGAPGVSQRNWNVTTAMAHGSQSGTVANILSPSTGVLVDSQGAATSAVVSFTMNNMWSSLNEELTPFGRLMSGYLDTNSSINSQVTVSSIPYANYDVYVYFGGNANDRTGMISDGSATYSFKTASSSVGSPGAYIRTTDTGNGNPSANYAVFEGGTSSSVTVTYLRGSANGGIHGIQIVPVGAASNYQVWAEGYGLDVEGEGSFAADADHDGVCNLLEFVLYSDPSKADSRPVMMFARDGGTFSLSYQKVRAADDFNLVVKWSENLTDWDDAGLSNSTLDDTDPEMRMLKASVSTLNRPRLYMRIEVESP